MSDEGHRNNQSPVGLSDETTDQKEDLDINLSDGVREKLPEDFDINDIGNIDLQEAENIASEEVLFLSESDLIEGLEDFDLMPLDEEGQDGTSTSSTPEAITTEQAVPGQEHDIDGAASAESSVGTGDEHVVLAEAGVDDEFLPEPAEPRQEPVGTQEEVLLMDDEDDEYIEADQEPEEYLLYDETREPEPDEEEEVDLTADYDIPVVDEDEDEVVGEDEDYIFVDLDEDATAGFEEEPGYDEVVDQDTEELSGEQEPVILADEIQDEEEFFEETEDELIFYDIEEDEDQAEPEQEVKDQDAQPGDEQEQGLLTVMDDDIDSLAPGVDRQGEHQQEQDAFPDKDGELSSDPMEDGLELYAEEVEEVQSRPAEEPGIGNVEPMPGAADDKKDDDGIKFYLDDDIDELSPEPDGEETEELEIHEYKPQPVKDDQDEMLAAKDVSGQEPSIVDDDIDNLSPVIIEEPDEHDIIIEAVDEHTGTNEVGAEISDDDSEEDVDEVTFDEPVFIIDELEDEPEANEMSTAVQDEIEPVDNEEDILSEEIVDDFKKTEPEPSSELPVDINEATFGGTVLSEPEPGSREIVENSVPVAQPSTPQPSPNGEDVIIIEFDDDRFYGTTEEPGQFDPREENEPVDENPFTVKGEEPAGPEKFQEDETVAAQEKEEDTFIEDEAEILEKETLNPFLADLSRQDDSVFIIDDSIVDNPSAQMDGGQSSQIDKISSLIPETLSGSSIVMREAHADEDREMIAYTPVEAVKGYDDLFLDFVDDELLYRDEELEFIHSAIIDEDYSRYIKNIDLFHGLKKDRAVTNAIEILGLTFNETEFIEDRLVGDEYENVDLESIAGLFRQADETSDHGLVKECTWLTSESDSLLDSEKQSIEENIESSRALVWEEDVNEIKAHLAELGIEIDTDQAEDIEQVYDISDSIVILEEPEELERFVEEFPEDKQDNMKKLLKYLDGLFEKLPESSVRKFAESEYFDLYVKVLNELGV